MTYSPFGLGIATLGTSQASKFVTVDSSGDLIIPDSDKFEFGTGSDMTLYHDATDSFITNKTGALNIATLTSGIAISIGHATSEVTVNDNLTVTGDFTVNGTTTSINQTYIDVTNAFVFEGATADAHETTLTIIDPTGSDKTVYLPNATGYLPVLAVASTTTITSTPAELNILDGVTATATELNYLDITTLGTAENSKAFTRKGDGTATFAGTTIADLGTITTADINGGTIDGAVIGGASTAAGSFAALAGTTGTFSGILKTDDTTDATSTTDGSLQTDGGLSVAKDVVVGNDLILKSDSAVIHLGDGKDVTITHVADIGLKFKNTSTTGDSGKGCVLTLQTGDTDIASGNVLGQIDFQAPNEGEGTDAILVAAGIAAVSEGDFSASNNATKLSFQTGASEAAAEKMSLSSAGNLTVSGDVTVNGGDITVAGATPKITIGDAGTEDTMMVFDGNAVDYRIGLDDGTDKLEIGTGSAHGTTAAIIIDSSGDITQLGTDSASSGEFLKFDGSKWIAAAATVSGLACDDLSIGDAAVTVSTSSGNVTIDSNAAAVSIDGHTGVTVASSSSGDITLDSVADIVIDAAGGNVEFKDAGTTQLTLDMDTTGGAQLIKLGVDGDDLQFQQFDGRAILTIVDDGYVAIGNGATGSGELRIYEDTDAGTNYTAFKVAAQAGDITYTLPTDDGDADQVLSTNGSGTLDWIAVTAATATVATTVTITDNENTDEDNAIIFTAGGDVDGGNIGLESDGNLLYNPSKGRITATDVAAAGTFVNAVEVVSDAGVTVSKGYTAITTGSSNRTATLPVAASTNVGATYTIKKVDSGTGNVSVTRAGDDTIDGGTSVVLYHQFESVTVIVRAADVWDII